jgi:hypothetical protein
MALFRAAFHCGEHRSGVIAIRVDRRQLASAPPRRRIDTVEQKFRLNSDRYWTTETAAFMRVCSELPTTARICVQQMQKWRSRSIFCCAHRGLTPFLP